MEVAEESELTPFVLATDDEYCVEAVEGSSVYYAPCDRGSRKQVWVLGAYDGGQRLIKYSESRSRDASCLARGTGGYAVCWRPALMMKSGSTF